jgi:hypothetical protein
MAKVLELRELSFVVKDLERAQKKFNEMGFDNCPAWTEEMPPIQARLTSMPVGNASISLMEPVGEAASPLTNFLAKRGEGIFSFTLLVDDVEEVAAAWSKAGVEFVLDEPIIVRGQYSAGVPVPIIRGNWTRPSTLNGLVIELQDFRTEDGQPYDPATATTTGS